MTDEIRDDEYSEPEELTTKDLAKAGERRSQRIPNEPILVPASQSRPEDRTERQTETQGNVSGSASGPAVAAARAKEEDLGPLFPADEANNLRAKWDSVQVKFVDEPRQAVEEADQLIAATMKRLAEIFTDERQELERHWDRSESVSTEDLRLGLRRYRSFFTRLLKF